MKKQTLIIIAAILLFALALGITLYPLISNYVNQKYASQIHTQYEALIQNTDNSDLIAAKRLAEQYNRSLSPVAAYSKDSLIQAAEEYDDLLNIGGDGIMGYVEIPAIQVSLPIYHGTDSETLERGVGHLLGSSLPIGGNSTHTILSGHSGMASQKMFTDLPQLKEGDVFYLYVLGETLAYQIHSINTVLPHETDLLGITANKDKCTLITCTPYGVNTHRLLVTGERIPYEEAQEIIEEIQASEEPIESTWEQEYLKGVYIALGIVLFLMTVVVIGVLYRRHK